MSRRSLPLPGLLGLMVAQALHAAEPVELRYDWLTQGERSGSLVTRVEADGRLVSDFEFNDRGRGPKQHEEIAIAADGTIRALRISGRSYLGSAVDERFDLADGKARWRTTLDRGERALSAPAFYAANAGTPQQLAVLAQALLKAPDGRMPLLPGGEARIERMATETVRRGEESREIALYAISGLGFTPSYVWLNPDQSLFGVSGGWMGAAPEGWAGVFDQLRARQEAAEGEHHQRIADRSTERLPEVWCIDNVRMLDVEAGTLRADAAVRVRDGRIEAAGPRGDAGCDGVHRIDGGGRVLMPGLWDMHVHLSVSDGILNIAAGVTGARDLANDHDLIVKLSEQFESGAVIGPRVSRAGFIDQKSPYTAPTGTAVTSLDEALSAVNWYAERGYPQIKIYSSISPEWVGPMAERVHAHGMKISGHVPAFMTAEQAVRQGFDEIQHINMLFLNFLAGAEADTRTPLRIQLVAERAHALDLDSPEVEAFIALLKDRDVVVDPTLGLFDRQFRQRSGQVSPALAAVIDHLPPRVQRSALSGSLAIDDENAPRFARSADALLRMIGKLHRAGVRIVPGTDDSTVPGLLLHRELELYAQAGIPNADVLRMATLESAKIAGLADRVGRIAPGQAADLVLIDGDPLADIGALRRTALVFRGDRLYRPDVLYRAIGVKPFVDSPR